MLSGLIAATLVLVTFLALTGALEAMFEGVGNCIDWDDSTNCVV